MTRILLALFALAASPAAAQDGPAAGGRPSDGLLVRPDLQALVDLQVRRDGASLAARLDDTDPAVRARAAFALASVQDTSAVPALLDALGDSDSRVRADAAFALGQTADSTAAGELLEALGREPDATVRARLLEAVGKTGGSAALGRLAETAPRPAEEWARAMAIARFGLRGVHHAPATAWLAGLLTSDDPARREAAAYAFGRWS
ncbi:MAG TPA: HEAT repeat domain-containing protein, partial [Gemmatimonadota bacterium]|nr:HEAT repeat domain-containing protein [Gemmatimonadota bacterium]